MTALSATDTNHVLQLKYVDLFFQVMGRTECSILIAFENNLCVQIVNAARRYIHQG